MSRRSSSHDGPLGRLGWRSGTEISSRATDAIPNPRSGRERRNRGATAREHAERMFPADCAELSASGERGQAGTRPAGGIRVIHVAMELPVAEEWFCRQTFSDGVTLLCEPHVDPFARCNIWHVRGRERDLIVDTGL